VGVSLGSDEKEWRSTFDLQGWSIPTTFHETTEEDGDVGDFYGLEYGRVLCHVLVVFRFAHASHTLSR
jgi:hypothetical protein